jgi:hypothetical protein
MVVAVAMGVAAAAAVVVGVAQVGVDPERESHQDVENDAGYRDDKHNWGGGGRGGEVGAGRGAEGWRPLHAAFATADKDGSLRRCSRLPAACGRRPAAPQGPTPTAPPPRAPPAKPPAHSCRPRARG